jgi:hypothetical protein
MNYFEYFSEIEERFSRRRGSILLLNTLDWALIETWREAGIPLAAVLRGIDSAFDKYEARSHKANGRLRKVNGLAWCAQAVMQSAEELVEASTGLAPTTSREPRESGFESDRVATFLDRNALALEAAATTQSSKNSGAPSAATPGAPSSTTASSSARVGSHEILTTTAARLRVLAAATRSDTPPPLDDLDRTLTVLEEKLFAALQASATEQELVDLRAQADRELAPYRSKISATQLRQIHQQFLHKRLLELRAIPRLSLFYMGHDDPQDSIS